jgi:hypothetical protein
VWQQVVGLANQANVGIVEVKKEENILHCCALQLDTMNPRFNHQVTDL